MHWTRTKIFLDDSDRQFVLSVQVAKSGKILHAKIEPFDFSKHDYVNGGKDFLMYATIARHLWGQFIHKENMMSPEGICKKWTKEQRAFADRSSVLTAIQDVVKGYWLSEGPPRPRL